MFIPFGFMSGIAAPVPDDGLRPVLSNWRINNDQKSRVLFDLSEVVTATTVTGWTITNMTISTVISEIMIQLTL